MTKHNLADCLHVLSRAGWAESWDVLIVNAHPKSLLGIGMDVPRMYKLLQALRGMRCLLRCRIHVWLGKVPEKIDNGTEGVSREDVYFIMDLIDLRIQEALGNVLAFIDDDMV